VGASGAGADSLAELSGPDRSGRANSILSWL
jgi:hypothetical protein